MRKNKLLLTILFPLSTTLVASLVAASCENTSLEDHAKNVKFDVENKSSKLSSAIQTSDLKISGYDSKNFELTIKKLIPKGRNLVIEYTFKNLKTNEQKDFSYEISGFSFTNYGLKFNHRLDSEANKVSPNEVLEKLKKATSLAEIAEIIKPYTHMDISGIDTEKYSYTLSAEHSSAGAGVLGLSFKVTSKSSGANHTVEWRVYGFKEGNDENTYIEAAGLKFGNLAAKDYANWPSPEIIKLLKELKNKPLKEQIAEFRKYCTLEGEFDESKYDLEFNWDYAHDHGPTNIHLELRWKLKSESQYQKVNWFVYGFASTANADAPLKINALKDEAKLLDSAQFHDLVKSLDQNSSSHLAFLQKYFDLSLTEPGKDFYYKANSKESKIAKQFDEEQDHPNKYHLAIDVIDKVNGFTKTIYLRDLQWFDLVSQAGYLKFETKNPDQNNFTIKVNELINKLKSELKDLDAANQIKKLVEILNSLSTDNYLDDDDSGKPIRKVFEASIDKELAKKYEMKIDLNSFKQVESKISYSKDHLLVDFEIKNKETNKTFKKTMKIFAIPKDN
ncbi:lipoprotein [Metamycoplasma arthritidis]|uniref:MAA2-related membrane protein n=1 Tax=Metamycoplasma arthritidis (strain 158L3-1) TaxID=243272 RepID=B3PMU2_META1|nr:hypothetical protein [Metamycoplasma arthritidis]ACF07344.1 MAA2-related membrane protein [Metamycoplasma arthritidis 158L3-1]VEU78867.1 lipoprotein [Metamycoplasma arthritidis]